MVSKDNKDVFADVAHQIAIGTPISSIKGPVNVDLYDKGLIVTLGGNATPITIDTTAGLLSAGGDTSLLRTSPSPLDLSNFKLDTQKTFAFGQSFSADGMDVHVRRDNVLIRYGTDLDKAILVTAIDSELRGIALYNDGVLSGGAIKAPVAGVHVTPQRDMDNALTYALI